MAKSPGLPTRLTVPICKSLVPMLVTLRSKDLDWRPAPRLPKSNASGAGLRIALLPPPAIGRLMDGLVASLEVISNPPVQNPLAMGWIYAMVMVQLCPFGKAFPAQGY